MFMSSAWCCNRLAFAFCLFALSASLLPVHGQSYLPQPPVLSCPSGSHSFQLGTDDLADFPMVGKAPAEYLVFTSRVSTGNYTGGSVRWLSIGLGDNRAQTTSLELRLALYLRINDSLSLLGQTVQVTLNPSGPQVLYAALPTPITLAYGADYVVTVFTLGLYYVQVVAGLTDPQPYAGFSSYQSGSAKALFTYPDNAQLSPTPSVPFLPLSALGCIADEPQPQSFAAADMQLYSFCAYSQQSQPASDPQDYSQQASSSLSVYTGVLAVNVSSASSSFGLYHPILAATALAILSRSGGYLDADGDSVTRSLVLGGSAVSPPASQRLYPLGAAAPIDLYGLSLLSVTGLQTVLRYSGQGSAIDTVTSAGGSTSSRLSAFSIQPYTWTDGIDSPLAYLPVCTPPLTTYNFAPLTCPDGSAYVEYGRSSEDWNPRDRNGGIPWPYYAQMMGNLIWFYSFTPQLPGSLAYELTVLLSDSPATLLHLRFGLFTAAGDSGPFFLVQQTAEVELLNPAAGLISAPLLPPVSLAANQSYYVAVWADQVVRAPWLTYAWSPVAAVGYESQGAGSFPSTVALSPVQSYGRLMSARTCVAQQTVVQYAFCGIFYHTTDVVTYSGVLSVLANCYSNAQGQYRVIVAVNGTETVRTSTQAAPSTYPLRLGGFLAQTTNFLYDTDNGGFALDGSGVQFLVRRGLDPNAVILNLRNSDRASDSGPQQSYQETLLQPNSYSNPTVVASFNASFVVRAGAALLPCAASIDATAPYVPPVNRVSPSSAPRISCDLRKDQVALGLGDQYIVDYATRTVAARLSSGVVYTRPFDGVPGASLQQISVAVLDNELLPAPVAIRLGIYSASSLQLLAQTNETVLYQVRQQVITMNLTSTLQLADSAELYWLALTANGSIAVASSNASSPTMAWPYSSARLSPTFASDSSVAWSPSLTGLGCSPSTHSLCAYFQYYSDPNARLPPTDTIVYQGLLNVDSSAPYPTRFGVGARVLAGSGYISSWRIYQAVALTTFQAYILAVDAHDVYLQPDSAAVVDTTGLQLLLNGGKSSVTLSYDSGSGAVVESGRTGLVVSSVSLRQLNVSTGLPSCSITDVPNYVLSWSSSSEPAPSCPDASSVVTYGDASPTDLEYTADSAVVWQGSTSLRRFRSSDSNYTELRWLSMGVLPNPGSILRLTFNLYDLQMRLLATTGQFSVANTQQQTLVAPLQSPVVVAPSTDYYLSATSSDYLYAPAAATFGPDLGTSGSASLIRALGAIGCLTEPPQLPSSVSSSSSSSSTAAPVTSATSSRALPASPTGNSQATTPSSAASSPAPPATSMVSTAAAAVPLVPMADSLSASWSTGEVVGVVLGCMIGSNLLLVLLWWLCCIRRHGGWRREKVSGTGDGRGGSYTAETSSSGRAEHEGGEESQVELNVRRLLRG